MFWICSACNQRKRKWCKSAAIDLEKFVKSHQVNLFLAGFSHLESLCVVVLSQALDASRVNDSERRHTRWSISSWFFCTYVVRKTVHWTVVSLLEPVVPEVPRQYHQIVTYQLTLSQPGGTNYSQHISTAPPPPRIFRPTYGPVLWSRTTLSTRWNIDR